MLKRACLLCLFLFAPGASVFGQSGAVEVPDRARPILSDFLSLQGVKGNQRQAPHQGIDITGPSGMPIIAAADGVVVEVDVGTCWGPSVVIDHGTGPDARPLIAVYGHLGDIGVRPGDRISRGQEIGVLGDNQDVFRCIGGVRHLHFQIGREHRSGGKGTTWGHVKYLVDGRVGVNPHLYWADGPNRVTCFDPKRRFQHGTLTYPVPCN